MCEWPLCQRLQTHLLRTARRNPLGASSALASGTMDPALVATSRLVAALQAIPELPWEQPPDASIS